jgi:alanyl-tRNA synthetase
MKSAEVRERFLKYFESKGHKILPGSSLVPADPTVLLTLAGMLQFKPIFLVQEKPKFKRAATVQKSYLF